MRAEIIPVDYIGPSLNKIYAGIFWAKRKKHADDAHWAVKIATKGIEPFTGPVTLEFRPRQKGRGYDCSNYSYNAKLLEDGLVMCGIISGDSVKYVKQITLYAPVKADRSQTVITIMEVE